MWQGWGVDYRCFEVDDPADFMARDFGLRGFNVTSPWKEAIVDFLDGVDEVATAVGAVNCVLVDGGKRMGFNTDGPALVDVLGGFGGDALILGTGGAAKAAAWALDRLGIGWRMVSRSGNGLRYGDLTEEVMAASGLIINATPVGMGVLEGERPAIPYEFVAPGHVLFDMIYNPARTAFLHAGRERGARTVNGWDMLVRQAELSRRIWEV